MSVLDLFRLEGKVVLVTGHRAVSVARWRVGTND
jgi:hypothetical protein